MPTQGDATTQEAEDLLVTVCQSAASIDGPGVVADVAGIAGPIVLELNNSGSGTSSLSVEGSFDGITWYACGWAQLDGQGTVARAATAIPILAAPFAHTYAVLDPYSRLRCRLSGSSGALSLTATIRAIPV